MKTVNLPLENEKGAKYYYFRDYLQQDVEDLNAFLETEKYLKTRTFAKKVLFTHEIKSNNQVEGYWDSIFLINQLIKNAETIANEDTRKRILNLYYAYDYILKRRDIDKDSVRELYRIISKGVIKPNLQTKMGEYYREAPVYILKNGRLDLEPDQGINYKNVERFMDAYFEFLHSPWAKGATEEYIKSQILHYYFVYIHPYFDVNGRTSRTLAMWYLFNKKDLSYMTFNRSISFMKSKYEKSLIELREKGDMTPFLKYMLDAERLELEKEYVINNIEKNIGKKLSNEEYLTLEYLLSMNSHLTLLDLIRMYNEFNTKKKKHIVLEDEINPLIEKGIILEKDPTKHGIADGIQNKRILVNGDMIDVDTKKIKILKLDKYTKENQD